MLFISALADFCKKVGKGDISSTSPTPSTAGGKAPPNPADKKPPNPADKEKEKDGTTMMTVADLVSRLGSKVDGFNLLELVQYLRESKIARKVRQVATPMGSLNEGLTSCLVDHKLLRLRSATRVDWTSAKCR